MTTITALPAAPSRDSSTFSEDADAFLGALPTFGTQLNTVAAEVAINAANASYSATVALAAANFKGSWTYLTGALAVPASVLHDGGLWLLLTNVSDVTAAEPGVSGAWADLTAVTDATTAQRLYTPRTIAISGKVTGTATSFDGSANIAISATALNALGEGQTWNDYSSVGRALSTTYTNSTGRAIMVSVTASFTGDSGGLAGIAYFYINGGIVSSTSRPRVPHTEVELDCFTFIIPDGVTYRVEPSNAQVSIYKWFELR